MSPALRRRIDARLALVPEPCAIAMGTRVDIVGMGLIEDVALHGRHAVVTLCLTDPACVHFRAMQAYIADVLVALPEIETVEVIQTTTILWTPDRAEAAA